jgi:signal transduction histidine kinase/FixJ family two-component response regulator/HPt (histidine-containing phosphotransfer) domain-containing protein
MPEKEARMLSIRKKTILIITGIVLVITASTLGTGLFISQYRFKEIVKNDLRSMSKVAAGMLSAEIGRLKQDAEFAAEVAGMNGGDLVQTLEGLIREFPWFTALSVMDHDGGILCAGEEDARPSARSRDSDYGRRAFAGETVLSTTVYSAGGQLLMHIWTPVDADRILVAALPGMYLSTIVSQYRIWKTGNVFLLDSEGVAVAAVWDFRVQERHNYIEWGQRDPYYREIGEVFHAMTQNEEGFGQYTLEGVDRYCAYRAVSGTDDWKVGVAAPLSESPLSHIQQMLFTLSAIFLVLGMIAALLATKSIAIPYEKMEELSRRAEAASESKTRFLASMSHEMRTPLNAIIGLSELELGYSNLEGESFTNVEKIYSAGMNLLGIINDLLDISKIESGQFTLVPVVYDMPSMINDTINLNIVRLGSKPVQFHLHVDADLPARLKGDELRVKQIFNNFLSNAFKYTDSGSVHWSISCVREGGRVKITSAIRDTGMGIRGEDLEKLFKDYYQADLHANYYVEGTGLGLSITNNLVKLMGGSITVESEYGSGSLFTVEFLQEAAGDETIGGEAAENLSLFRYSAQRRNRNQKLPRADMSYATVLVVDDVLTNLDVTRGMLRPYGITVECVTSGAEAIRRIREEKVRYSAIFMDHMMPGMDGIETVRIIRREIGTEYARTVPVIALTANAILGNDSLFLENGFQAFLSKPIDILGLDNVLNQWVRDKSQERNRRLSRGSKKAPARNHAGPSGDFAVPGLNSGPVLARFGYDREAYRTVLRSFAAQLPTFIGALQSPGAVDLDAYRIAVHGLKGSGRSVGADQLGDAAEQLEAAAARGDRAFIQDHNGPLIAASEQFLAGLKAFFQNTAEAPLPAQPERDSPDPELIAAIRRACAAYDMAALREALSGLEAFRYRSHPDLAGWIRERAGKSDFEAIRERLDSI